MTDHRQPSRLLHIGLWVAGVVSFGGLAAMIFIAVNEIRAGRGLDTYRTLWMVEDNWIGFLVFVVAAVVALAVGFFFRLKECRELRELESKYSGGRHG